jgi:hypothetical protein
LPVNTGLLLEEIHEEIHFLSPWSFMRTRTVIGWLSAAFLLEKSGCEQVEVRLGVRLPQLVDIVNIES